LGVEGRWGGTREGGSKQIFTDYLYEYTYAEKKSQRGKSEKIGIIGFLGEGERRDGGVAGKKRSTP